MTFALREAHERNIARSNKLLLTSKLSDVERRFVEVRLVEEQAAMDAIEDRPKLSD